MQVDTSLKTCLETKHSTNGIEVKDKDMELIYRLVGHTTKTTRQKMIANHIVP